MLFLDLEKLKIEKEYNYQTYTVEINDTNYLEGTLAQIKVAAENALEKLFDTLPSIEAVYEIVLAGEGEATGEEAEDFVSAIHVIVRAFFNRISTNNGWARERRLDVPKNLKCLKANLSVIKNAINKKTIINKFNLIIKYKDLAYYLVDERGIETSEFIHDVDELNTTDMED